MHEIINKEMWFDAGSETTVVSAATARTIADKLASYKTALQSAENALQLAKLVASGAKTSYKEVLCAIEGAHDHVQYAIGGQYVMRDVRGN